MATSAGVYFIEDHEDTDCELIDHKNSHPRQPQETLMGVGYQAKKRKNHDDKFGKESVTPDSPFFFVHTLYYGDITTDRKLKSRSQTSIKP